MPQPRLLHPVLVGIEPLLRLDTFGDDDYREPVSHAARSTKVLVIGQPHWTMDDRLHQTLIGPEREATGYILFRTVDLKNVGIKQLAEGDRVTTIGKGAHLIDVDFYVVGLRMTGYWPDQGGSTLVKAFFRDRSRSKQTPKGMT